MSFQVLTLVPMRTTGPNKVCVFTGKGPKTKHTQGRVLSHTHAHTRNVHEPIQTHTCIQAHTCIPIRQHTHTLLELYAQKVMSEISAKSLVP